MSDPAIRHAVIMAAGRGARMMPLTAHIPKPMAEVRGMSLITHGIRALCERIPSIHVTVGYKGALLASHVISLGVSSVFNTEGQPNSWWVYHTLLRLLDEPVFVLTCDNIMALDFESLEADYLALGSPAGMVIPVKPVPGLEGDYIFHEGNVVTELNRDKPGEIYCSGIQILNPAKINRLTTEPEGGDFYALWQQLIAQRQLAVSNVLPSHWISIDTVSHLNEANAV
ncbi:MAG: NDP-sugar synthase [Chthoniobacteraceae bacterium]